MAERLIELSPEEKQQLKEALDRIQLLRQELQRARRAGLDVTELENQLNQAEQQLRRIKMVYVDEA